MRKTPSGCDEEPVFCCGRQTVCKKTTVRNNCIMHRFAGVLLFAVLASAPLLAQQSLVDGNVMLGIERTTNLAAGWTAVPLTAGSVTSDGKFRPGSWGHSNTQFFRMRILPSTSNDFRGVYMGHPVISYTNENGQPVVDTNGRIGAFVRPDGSATVVAAAENPLYGGWVAIAANDVIVGPNGAFSGSWGRTSSLCTDPAVYFSGNISNGAFSGVFTVYNADAPFNVTNASFAGVRKSDEGFARNLDGLWLTTFNKDTNKGVNLTVAAADGSIVSYSIATPGGEDGFYTTISEGLTFASAFNETFVEGTVDTNARRVTGTVTNLFPWGSDAGTFSGLLVEPNN